MLLSVAMVRHDPAMRRLAIVIPLLVLMAGCGSSSSTTTPSSTSTSTSTRTSTSSAAAPPASTGTSTGSTRSGGGALTLSETEFKITPKNGAVASTGTIAITVKNNGKIVHALAVQTPTGVVKTGNIAPGATATLAVDLSKAGTYTFYCPIDHHRQLGMVGTLTVGGPSSGGAAAGGAGSGTTTSAPSSGGAPAY
jgi:uncharacterized cupredoxin-like copper-binding protein